MELEAVEETGSGNRETRKAAPTWVKVTLAVCVTTTVSVWEVAVNTAVPAVVDLTVKVATPLALVIAAPAGLMTGVPGPEVFARVTPSLATARPEASFSVTVMVEDAVPSPAMVVGEATTVEVPAFTGPATGTVWKSTPAVPVMVTDSLVAVKVSMPTALDLTVKVTTPLALLVLLLVVMSALPLPAGKPLCRGAADHRNSSA